MVGATGYRQARAVQETVEESVEEPGGPVIGASVTDAAPAGPSVVLASSPAQEATHVARILRGEHIHHATGWDQMAVIVRSTAQAQAVARDLRRRGVPLASRTPAVLLRTEPAARAALAQRAYATVDLMASYQISKNLRLRLNADNIFNKKYKTMPDIHVYGTPRSFTASVRYTF